MQTMNPKPRRLARLGAAAALVLLTGGWPLAALAQAAVPAAPGGARLPAAVAPQHDASPSPPRDPGVHLQPDSRAAERAGAHGAAPAARGLSPRGTDSRHGGGADSGAPRGDAAGGTRGAASGGGAGSGDAHGY
ncbi:hypothetical protein [Burkholderia glumae]|uniref:hypothetical protein n=1 Tax=Burkholderia glumae TaxID=337 RepID=UPI0020372ED1|nr:hypothetical protein [Burkholderia glumae]MCM2494515.1 hypothetical protein [Burkholderia glumae]MCM2545424.1 hypothetical protein [Burkholderia glumae]